MQSTSILIFFLFAFVIFSVFHNHYTKLVLFGIDQRLNQGCQDFLDRPIVLIVGVIIRQVYFGDIPISRNRTEKYS